MKHHVLTLIAGAGAYLIDAGIALATTGRKMTKWAIPRLHPAEQSNAELDERIG